MAIASLPQSEAEYTSRSIDSTGSGFFSLIATTRLRKVIYTDKWRIIAAFVILRAMSQIFVVVTSFAKTGTMNFEKALH